MLQSMDSKTGMAESTRQGSCGWTVVAASPWELWVLGDHPPLHPGKAVSPCSSPHGCWETRKAVCQWAVKRTPHGGQAARSSGPYFPLLGGFSSTMRFSFTFPLPQDICLTFALCGCEGSVLGTVLLNIFALKEEAQMFGERLAVARFLPAPPPPPPRTHLPPSVR